MFFRGRRAVAYVKLNLSSFFFKTAQAPWTAVDAGVPEAWVVASVLGSLNPGSKPRVIQVGQSDHHGQGWDPAAVAALLDARKNRSGSLVAVLARGDYQLMLLPRPPVPVAELERSVRWAIAPQVDFPVDNAVLVTMELPAVRTAESSPTAAMSPAADEAQKSMYVVAAQQEAVQAASEAFKTAGHALDVVDIRETAQRNIAALLETPDECLCLLRMFAAGFQLTFTHRGELYLDRFIAQPIDALQAGDEFERERLIERIVQQTLLSVSHIQTHHPGLSVQRVVLCPLPIALNLNSSLQQQLGLPVETLDLSDVFDLTDVPQLQDAGQQARYFVALGAALRGQGNAS